MTDGQTRLWGRLDPPALTGSVDDYNPTGMSTSTVIFLTADGNYNITGLVGGAKLRQVRFFNNTTNRTFGFPGLTGSSAENQWGHSGTPSISRGESITFTYDDSASLWRMDGRVSAGSGTTLPVDDGTGVVKGSSDATKIGRFEVDTNVPTGTTVALAFPAQNGTIATLALAETLTNKTLTTPTIASFVNATHTHTDAASGGALFPVSDATGIVKGSSDATKVLRFEVDGFTTATTRVLTPPNFDGTIATLAGTETLTNKTLTSPTINTPVVAGGTLAGTAVISDGSFQGFKDQNGNEVLQLAGVASAVNHCAFSNAATGSGPTIQPGTGGDTNVPQNVTGRGTRGVRQGISGELLEECGAGTTNPAATEEGSRRYRTDLDYGFALETTRSKWLGPEFPVYFGHSASDLAASTRLRTVGLGSDTDCVYELPFAYTIVAYSYARADSDSSTFEVMVNASTVALTISSSATRGSATNTDVDLAAGDELWARVGSGAANAMSPRTLVLWLRRRAT